MLGVPVKFLARYPAVLAFAMFANAALAQSFTWTGSTSSDPLLNANWGGTAPSGTGAENLFFDQTASSFIIGFPASTAIPFNSIPFNGTRSLTYTFNGGSASALILNGNLSANGSGDINFNAPLAISLAAGTHTVSVASGINLTAAGLVT